MRVLNTPQNFARAAEALYLGDRLHKGRIDGSEYHRTRLTTPCVVDPDPRATGNAPRGDPKFHSGLTMFEHKPKRRQRPLPAPPRPFVPWNLEDGDWWIIYARATGHRLYRIKGSYCHVMRQANLAASAQGAGVNDFYLRREQ